MRQALAHWPAVLVIAGTVGVVAWIVWPQMKAKPPALVAPESSYVFVPSFEYAENSTRSFRLAHKASRFH